MVASLSQLAGSTALVSYLWGGSAPEEEGLVSTGGKGAAEQPATAATGGGVSPAAAEGAAAMGAGTKPAPQPGRQPGARFALLVLTCINLLNYVDRCVCFVGFGGVCACVC